MEIIAIICSILFFLSLGVLTNTLTDLYFNGKQNDCDYKLKNNVDEYIEKYMPNTVSLAKNFKEFTSHMHKIDPNINLELVQNFEKHEFLYFGHYLFIKENKVLSNAIYKLIIDEMDLLIQNLLIMNGYDRFSFNNEVANQNGMSTLQKNQKLKKLIDRKNSNNFIYKTFLFDIVNSLLYWATTKIGHNAFQMLNNQYSTIMSYIFDKYCKEIKLHYDKELLNRIIFDIK